MTVAAVAACLCKTVSRNGSLELRNGKGTIGKIEEYRWNSVEEARNEREKKRGKHARYCLPRHRPPLARYPVELEGKSLNIPESLPSIEDRGNTSLHPFYVTSSTRILSRSRHTPCLGKSERRFDVHDWFSRELCNLKGGLRGLWEWRFVWYIEHYTIIDWASQKPVISTCFCRFHWLMFDCRETDDLL